MSRRRRRRRGGEGRRLEDDTADVFIKGEYEFCIEVGGEGGRRALRDIRERRWKRNRKRTEASWTECGGNEEEK